MSRPIRHFLSHQNGDRAALIRLETDMRRRGLLSWRDRKDQARGVATDPAVIKAIRDDTDGFVFYGSSKLLTSKYVWENEWPIAYLRNQAEAGNGHPFPYPLIPIFIGKTGPGDLRDAARSYRQPVPTAFNGERLRAGADGRRVVANYLLETAIARRQAEIGLDPIRILVSTFAIPHHPDADLVVDWGPEFTDNIATPWPDLLRARDDLADVLARAALPIEFVVQARLGPAFAFGNAFPSVSKMTIVSTDGWRLGAAEDPARIDATETLDPTGDPRVGVVQVSLARDVSVAVDHAVTGFDIRASRRLSIRFGPSADRVAADVAAAATATFASRLKALRDNGITETHIFLAVPAPLALLLGAAINAGPAMTLYHTADGQYVKAVRLP